MIDGRSQAAPKGASADLPREHSSSELRPNCRVLVVEGDPKLLTFYRKAFERLGCSTEGFNGVEKALADLQNWSPDIAFVDIGLGGAACRLDLCRTLSRNSTDGCYIVGQCDIAGLDTLRYASSIGVHMFLRKPSSLRDVEWAVSQAQKWRTNRSNAQIGRYA